MARTGTITLPVRDIQTVALAVEHLDALQTVEITQVDDIVTLTWHTNGTSGAVIHKGEIVGKDPQ